MTNSETGGWVVYQRDGDQSVGMAQQGLADVERLTPFTPATRVNVGSIAKLLTAAMVCDTWRTEAQRNSTLLGTVMPAIRDHWVGEVSVEQLLRHDTGIFDYRTLLEMSGYRGPLYFNRASIVSKVLDEPGPSTVSSQYSNSNYVLLRLMIEAWTASDFRTVTRRLLNNGRNVGFWLTDPEELICSRGTGYRITSSGRLKRWVLEADDAGASNYWASLTELIALIDLLLALHADKEHSFVRYGAAATFEDGFLVIGNDGGFSSAVLVKGGTVESAALSNIVTRPAYSFFESKLADLSLEEASHLRPVESLQVESHVSGRMDELVGRYTSQLHEVQVEVREVDGVLEVQIGPHSFRLDGSNPRRLALQRDGDSVLLNYEHIRGLRLSAIV